MANSSRKGRIGRSGYWTIFGLYVVAALGLMGFALYSIVGGDLGRGVTAILLMAPLGLYFRVIEMRRCRDIGWPAFLPWLLFVVPIGMSFTIQLSGLGNDLDTAIAALTVPLLVAVIDFGFAIAIGCIATRDEGEDYAAIFGGEPQPARAPAYSEAGPRTRHEATANPDYDRFDEAIARALAARQSAEPALAVTEGAEPAIVASAHARAVAGFGRKGV